MRDVWRWPMVWAGLVSGLFLIVDLGFFAANLLKLREGGWIPLALGVVLFLIMTTWHRGLFALRARLGEGEDRPDEFLADLSAGRITRVPGTAVFLSRTGVAVPIMLIRHVAQMRALQETVVTLTLVFEEVPRVASGQRAVVERVAEGFWHVTVRFGFIEIPNVNVALSSARDQGCPVRLDDAVFFGAHDSVVPSKGRPRLPAWRRMLFAFMYRNAVRAPDRFDLPADRFLEVGRQVEL
jgi:KUP system potassium uptake protein